MEDRERTHEEYLLILAAFRKMILHIENSTESLSHLSDMVIYRASALIDRVLEGLGIDFDEALVILKAHYSNLSAREELLRDRLLAAFDNMIEFAAAEQYTMIQELPYEVDHKDMAIYEAICQRYNEHYAATENSQVLHAAMIAAMWIETSEDSNITFNTQRDERVRELHASFDGVTYRKSEFPTELIPPIEWACRCFLTSDDLGAVMMSIGKDGVSVNPIFKESLATCGRIFSDAHPYFQKSLPNEVRAIITKLKKQLHLNEDRS